MAPGRLVRNKYGSKEEMESAMFIEYMKYALGKSRLDEVRELLGLRR
jgi:hypothetical protein